MSTLTLIVVVLVAAGFGIVAAYGAGKASAGPSRAEKRELADLRKLVSQIDRIAYNNRDVNPELSVQIIDEIGTYKNQETK